MMKQTSCPMLRAVKAALLTLAAAAGIMMTNACQKEPFAPAENAPKAGYMTVKFHAGPVETRTEIAAPEIYAGPVDTRTEFAAPEGKKYPTLWSAGDKVAITLASKCSDADSVVVTPTVSADRKSMSFKAEVPVSTADKDAFCAVVPAIAVKSLSATNRTWNLEIPAKQTPTAGSPDPQAQILWARTPFSGTPPEADLAFNHFVAYGKLSLKNFYMMATPVKSVSLEAEVPITGRYFLFIDDATKDGVSYKAGDVTENVPAKTLTLNTELCCDSADPRTEDVWFTCLPADLSNTKLKITVTTETGSYTREVAVPANRKFEAGKVTNISFDMKGILPSMPTAFFKVTADNQLKDGDEIIIAGYGVDKSDANYKGWFALTDSQKGNNRQATMIEVLEEDTKIQDPAANVEIVVLEKAATAGEWYLRATKHGGYLYAAATKASSNNYLRTATADGKDASGNAIDDFEARRTWDISINTDGTASIISDLSKSHADYAIILRLNVDNLVSNPLISCYTLKSTAPRPSIFRKAAAASFPNIEKQWICWANIYGQVFTEEVEGCDLYMYDIGVTYKHKITYLDKVSGDWSAPSPQNDAPYVLSLTPEGDVMLSWDTGEPAELYHFYIFRDITETSMTKCLYYYDQELNPSLYSSIYYDRYGAYHPHPLVVAPSNIPLPEYKEAVLVVDGVKFTLAGTEISDYNHSRHFIDDILHGQACTLPIVRMNNAGTAEDFAKVDVTGKIAVVDRGEISFWVKLQNASEAGAIAILCANNQPGVVHANLSELPSTVKRIPFLTITREAGQALNGKTSADFDLVYEPGFFQD